MELINMFFKDRKLCEFPNDIVKISAKTDVMNFAHPVPEQTADEILSKIIDARFAFKKDLNKVIAFLTLVILILTKLYYMILYQVVYMEC